MPTPLYLLLSLTLLSSDALARGSHGSSSDAKAMISLALLVGLAAIGTAIRKRYPNFLPVIGGIFVYLTLGVLAAAMLAGAGLIEDSAIFWTGLVIAVAAPFVLVWISERREKKEPTDS